VAQIIEESLFVDDGELLEYRPGGDGTVSVWRFRKYATGDDDEAIQRKIFDVSYKVVAKQRNAEKAGQASDDPAGEMRLKQGAARARIEQMSVNWEGPAFFLPSDTKGPNGQTYKKATLPPCTPFFIGRLRSSTLAKVEKFLDDNQEEDELADASFPEES
jgi:hypothetical protein